MNYAQHRLVGQRLRRSETALVCQKWCIIEKESRQSRRCRWVTPLVLLSCSMGKKSMSEFLPDDETIERVSRELPDLDNLAMSVMKLFPDYISIKYPAESNVPVAAVCLQDTMNALFQVRLGLSECLHHKIWYQEKCNPPNEELAIIFSRFYIDAIVSQLYAAGEHLANGIICMLELTDAQLEKYRNRRISQQSIVGHYLAKKQADNPITESVLALAASREWVQSMCYRGNLVHEQPPSVSGLGPVYKRRRRWIQSDDGKSAKLSVGSEDGAEYLINEILQFVQPAILQFVDLFSKVVSFYLDMIGKKGIVLTKDGYQVKLKQ